MHISHVEIANFRALEAVSVPLNQFSVLIGENDVGKTSFLYALDKFFANKKFDEKTDWFKEDVKNDIRFVLTFSGVPSDSQLEPFVKGDGSIVISKVFPFEKPPVVKAILDDLSAVDLPKAVLILIRCQIETNYPGPSRKAAQAFTVSRQLGQALFQLPSDAGEV